MRNNNPFHGETDSQPNSNKPEMRFSVKRIDNLILELDYSSNQILQPKQVDALIFASNFPWARSLTESDLIIIPIK